MKEPKWLTAKLVRAIHSDLLAKYGGLQGLQGPLLESTSARPKNAYHYGIQELHAMAASYGFGFAKNHCFSDGNKRIALAAMETFLRINGYRVAADRQELLAVVLSVASGSTSKEELATWLSHHIAERV